MFLRTQGNDFFETFFSDLAFSAMVLKKLLIIFSIFIGFVIDLLFWESKVGTEKVDLLTKIKFLIPFHIFFDHSRYS